MIFHKKPKNELLWSKKRAPLVAQSVKNLPTNVEDVGLIPGSERPPREENGNPLQCSCLENPMDRGFWWTTVHRVAKESVTP